MVVRGDQFAFNYDMKQRPHRIRNRQTVLPEEAP